MLVVVPAAQAPEISSSRALRVAKEYDAECKLLSSVNKVEFLRKKSECMQFLDLKLKGQLHKVVLGYEAILDLSPKKLIAFGCMVLDTIKHLT